MSIILINGKIVTMDEGTPICEAVAIEGNRIAKVGKNEDILLLKNDDSTVIDLEGKMVVPGFNDSHMHLLSYGISLNQVDLGGTKSVGEIADRIKNFINERDIKPGQWVKGSNWNQDYFTSEKIFPTKYDLDKVSTEHPIVITRACYHIYIVNSKALEVLGIDKNTPQIEGGKFDLDASGEPLGIFRENAMNLIKSKMPEPDVDELKAILKEAISNASKTGITSIQTDDVEHIASKDYEKIFRAYKELAEENELNVRINEQCLLPNMQRLTEFLDKGYRTGDGDNFFKIGPVKLLSDGSLGARTAYMTEPYADDSSTKGISVFTQEQLDELVKTSHDNGMPAAVHCIGDAAMYMAFESFEKAQKANPRKDARHSIVHCQITDDTLLSKYRDLDVIAHIQPIFINYDLHIVEDRVGKEKAKLTYNFKEMLNRGVHVAIGSDCPVEPFTVMNNLYSAVTRKDLSGYPENGWLPEQKLSVDEALYCFTMGGAHASFEEDIKGSISEGKLADMVVISDDLYSIEPDKIKDVEILTTIFDGKIIYNK